jgi:hypothetical protein
MARQRVGKLVFVARCSSRGKSLRERRIEWRLRVRGYAGKFILLAGRAGRGKSLGGRRVGWRLRLPG